MPSARSPSILALRNVKLHVIAERIINGGLLDVGQSRSSQRRP
jgi:hypothetical protein